MDVLGLVTGQHAAVVTVNFGPATFSNQPVPETVVRAESLPVSVR